MFSCIAFRAGKSQARRTGLRGQMRMGLSVLALLGAVGSVSAARKDWFQVSLAEYRAWRNTLAQNPADARQRVLAAIEAVKKEAVAAALSGGKPKNMTRANFEQTVWRDRGLLVWRTLETVIDRERVDRALQKFDERYTGLGASGFRRACEEISGRDLRWFFDYYVDGAELPEIALRRSAGSAPNEVTGEILVKNAPAAFQVRVEFRFFTSGGVMEHSVATSGPATPFTVTARHPVLRVVVDPEERILKRVR